MRRRCFSVLGTLRGIIIKPCDPDAPAPVAKPDVVKAGPNSRTRVRPGFHNKRPRQVHR